MCGRYYRKADKQKIAEAFHARLVDDGTPSPPWDYNVAPTTIQPIIRNNRDTNERELVSVRWGLIPFFTKDIKEVKGVSTINARAETVAISAHTASPSRRAAATLLLRCRESARSSPVPGRNRRRVGLSVLFTGLSRTGKTIAAEVLAHELRLDLYRVDCLRWEYALFYATMHSRAAHGGVTGPPSRLVPGPHFVIQSEPMKTILRSVAALELLFVFPAVLFITALFARNIQPLRYEPAHTAQRIVAWYAASPHIGLWVLLIALPLVVVVIGSATLIREWHRNQELRVATLKVIGVIRSQAPSILIAGATAMALWILAIVALHVLTD